MIVCKGYPSAIVTKGFAAPSGATPVDGGGGGGDRWDRDWQDGPSRPWWWKKRINRFAAAAEAPQP